MSAVDFAYLEAFVGHDRGIVREVLTLFRQQAHAWSQTLDGEAADWRDVVHTIKGAARGVGANALGDACAAAEASPGGDLAGVRQALREAVAAIDAYQAKAA
jgi:HPt (histidine-containing phosphotransfer) domain-containing protein